MSDQPATPQSRPNPLLRKLTPRAASLLSPCLEFTQLMSGDRLESPRRPIAHLFFPDTALVSFAALGFGERPIDVGAAAKAPEQHALVSGLDGDEHARRQCRDEHENKQQDEGKRQAVVFDPVDAPPCDPYQAP